MALLIPFMVTVLGARGALWLVRSKAASSERPWSLACAAGMAVVFILTGTTHFVEPGRTGLVAIVPSWVPQPALAVTITGLLEFALAAALLIRRTRRWAAIGSVALLVALFPANVIAAEEARHYASPSTALLPRTLLQVLFISACCLISLRSQALPQSDGRLRS